MNILDHCIIPDWPAPAHVRAVQTTRNGGVSPAPYASFNLGGHVGDAPQAVAHNRQLLAPLMPGEPLWLQQVHGTVVVDAGLASCLPQADACIARQRGAVCVVLTADCLPVLLCDAAGTVVAAVHAGWKGLAAGVIEATVQAMEVAPHQLLAWFGPAISQRAFEVGEEVRTAFMPDNPLGDAALPLLERGIEGDFCARMKFKSPLPPLCEMGKCSSATGRGANELSGLMEQQAQAVAAFIPSPPVGEGQGRARESKYLADLYLLARQRLQRLGVTRIYGGDFCTYSDPARFFSYRRDGVTGRMGTFIWLEEKSS